MNTWRRGVVIAVTAILLLVPSIVAQPVDAAPKKGKQAQISSLKEQLSEVSGDESELLGRLDEINTRKAAVDGDVADVQGQINQVQQELALATSKLEAAKAEADRAQQELALAEAALKANTERLQQQAVNAYIGKEPMSSMGTAILKTEDLSAAGAASAYMRQIVADRRKVVEEQRELRAQAEELARRLATLQAQAAGEQNAIVGHEAELNTRKIALDDLNAKVQVEVDAQNALLNEAESKRSAFEARLADLQAESDSVGASLRSAGGGSASTPPPAAPRGGKMFSSPVSGASMSSPFGYRIHPIFGTRILHAGQDWAVPTGTALRAVGDGTVAKAGAVSGYGNYTCINHGGGIASCYAHQSAINVSVGQKVTRGQIIGRSGNTGNSTGPHLHFEIRVNGTPVDPRGYI